MRIQLLEGERGAVPFIVDRTVKPITESRNGVTISRIPGRFSICDSVNGNNRKYPKVVWEKNLQEGSNLQRTIQRNAAFGLLEHPSNGQISLLSPIAVVVTSAKLVEAKDPLTGKTIWEVQGELTIVPRTAEGEKLLGLIDIGYNPLVSSRGFGSVLKDDTGVDVVQEDYICEGWDVVLRPSFETAELQPNREGKQQESAPARKNDEQALTEDAGQRGINLWRVYQSLSTQKHGKSFAALSDSQADEIVQAASAMPREELVKIHDSFDPAKQENLKGNAAPSSAPAPAGGSAKPIIETMDINTLKGRISSIRSARVPTDPARFAAGMNEMAELHQEVANFVAEDGKRSWQGDQLHEELKVVERTWSATALAPKQEATKLGESYKKALRLTKVLGEAAVSFKKKLTEAIQQSAATTKLVEDLTQRGQAWVALADKRKEYIAQLEHKLEVACEALDIIRDRYHEDVTDLGRRVITLEFGAKAQEESIQKQLKEAKKPKDIVAIREQLAPPKPEGEGKPAPQQESKPGEGTPAPTNENKNTSGAPKAPENKPGDQPVIEARVLVPSVRSVTESVEMVKRLSASAK